MRLPSRTILYLCTFMVAISVASHVVISRSNAFWSFCRERARFEIDLPVYVDAILHSLAPGQAQIVFSGSSIARFHISPHLIAERCGLDRKEVLQLYLPGAPPTEYAMLTPGLVQLRPRIVVYLASVWVLRDDVDLDIMRFYSPPIALEIFGWEGLLAEYPSHASQLVASSHVIVRHREPLRRMLLRPLLLGLSGEPNDRPLRRWVDEPQVRRRILARNNTTFDDFHCSGPNVRALGVMARHLRTQDIQFVVVAAPTQDQWGRNADLGRLADNCLATHAAENDYLYIPRSRLGRFGPSDFKSNTHLNGRGRWKFSETISDYLEPRLESDGRGK